MSKEEEMGIESERCFRCASDGKTFDQTSYWYHYTGSLLLLLEVVVQLEVVCFGSQGIWFWSFRSN